MSADEQGAAPERPPRYEYEEEISLFQVGSVLLRGRWVIVRTVAITSLVGLALALLSPHEYTSSTSFLPNSGERGALSGVSGLAQSFGLSLPYAGDAERGPEFYRELVTSREVLDSLIARVLARESDDDGSVDVVTYFEVEAETRAGAIAKTREILRAEVIAVSVGRETGIVTVDVTTADADLSAAIGSEILDLISRFDLDTRQSQASAERAFSEKRLEELRDELTIAENSLKQFLIDNRSFANSPPLQFEHDRLQRQVVMRQELVTAMAQAYERARINEVRDLPVITVIESPEVPALPDPRGRLLKIVLAILLGVMVGSALAFMSAYGRRAQKDGSRDYREFRSLLTVAGEELSGLWRRGRKSGV